MSILKTIVVGIVAHIAHLRHPDKPRVYLPDVELPTDLTEQEVRAALAAAATEFPQFADWEHSIVDLLKLTHPEDPEAASFANRKALAEEQGIAEYVGSVKQNVDLHRLTMKALRQHGIPLPETS